MGWLSTSSCFVACLLVRTRQHVWPGGGDLHMVRVAGVPRNLIIQFESDTIDESPRLHSVLEGNSTVARELRYKVCH